MSFRFTKLLQAIRAGNSTPSVPSFYFNFSNPQNVTLGAEQARGNITSTQNAHITMSASLSRVVGVAPLYVNIDMTGTTSDLTANATHDLFYSVNWGDSGAGQWANGVQSPGLTDKNWSFGPVGGHVFETPGTYLVTPTSTDGVNSAAKPGYVTVLDPNVVYAGTDTICISHSNNFTGAPSGATQVNTAGNTDMYAALNTYKASNKRILFCKADSWTCSAQNTFTGIAGMTISGYGTGAARTAVFNASASDTLVSVTPSYWSAGGSVFYFDAENSDIRVHNFKIASNSAVKAVGIGATISGILVAKIEIRECSAGFSAPGPVGSVDSVLDEHCMYECLVDDLYGYSGVDTPRANVTTTNGVADIAATGHYYAIGYKVHFPTAGEGTTQFPSTGTFPTGFAVTTGYFISSAGFGANSFRLAPTQADALAGTNTITPTSSGTYPLFSNGISGGIGAFVAFVRGGIMGCYLDSCNHGEQTLRTPFLDRAHINNNFIARPNQGKGILKIHSCIYASIPKYTEKFVVSANVLSLRNGFSLGSTVAGVTITEVGDSSMGITNGGASGYEKVRNGIIETNITQGCLGNPKSSTGSTFVVLGGPNFTVRNNIADFSVGDRDSPVTGVDPYTFTQFAAVSSATDDPTTGVRLYNNTLYSNIANAQVACFVNVNSPTKVTATGLSSTSVFTSTATHYLVVGSKVWFPPGTTPPAPFVASTFPTPTYYYVTATSLGATTFTLNSTVGGGGAPTAITLDGTCYVYRSNEVNDLRIQNNLWYFKNRATAGVNVYLGGNPTAVPTAVVETPNTNTVQTALIDPLFAVQPPVALADWRPGTGSYAIGSGATVPVLRDFNNVTRVGGTYDLGAVLP